MSACVMVFHGCRHHTPELVLTASPLCIGFYAHSYNVVMLALFALGGEMLCKK